MVILIQCLLPAYQMEQSLAAPVLPKFYVDDDYNSSTPGWQTDHFDRIQDAITMATSGDRIIVYEGIYYEHLTVNKGVSIFGEDRDDTIIDGSNTGNVIEVTTHYADISTFTIQNGGNNGDNAIVKVTSSGGDCKIIDNVIKGGTHGLYLDRCHQNTIAYNSITSNENGTFLVSSDNNLLEYNIIQTNSNNGVFLNRTCEETTISNNTIYDNGNNGIYLNDECQDNSIKDNDIATNGNTGIRVEDDCSSIEIKDNSVSSNNNYGIMIVGSSNTVQGNMVTANDKHGIFLLADDNSIVTDNTAEDNILDGIRLQNTTNAGISSNYLLNNLRYGIHVNYYAEGNRIFDNYFEGNGVNARDISSYGNNWSHAKTSGSSIIKGPYIGGNYWDDYNGTDTDGDGIGENPYNITGGGSTDIYPLVYRRPIADAGGPYNGATRETLIFSGIDSQSPDGPIISYNWDFGDGSRGFGQNVSHAYETAGTYTVKLTIINDLGGTARDTTTATITKDTTPPEISVVIHSSSSAALADVYTFGVYVTDNVEVATVNIEYWYDDAIEHITAEMNSKGNHYYEKVIIFEQKPERVYCIISATDVSDNLNATMRPFALFQAPTSVNVSEPINFDGSASFDLDGDIIQYSWDFGDGTTGSEATFTHIYVADGNYTATLTVTDNSGNKGSSHSRIRVYPNRPKKTSNETLNEINNNTDYQITLTQPFLCYDLDNDGTYDTFFDPNNLLHMVHTPVTIEGNESFLLSIDTDDIPEFFWTPDTDTITTINHIIASFDENDITIDEAKEQATLTITVDKASWIFIELADTKYPKAALESVHDTTHTRKIPEDRIFRENGNIYVFDDPGTTYQFLFTGIFPELEKPTFSPPEGGIIDEDTPTITITYSIPVTITYASFASIRITDGITTTDNKVFHYTPPGYYEDGTYAFDIEAQAMQGKSDDYSSIVLFYYQYAEPPQQSFLEKYWIWIALSLIFMGGIAVYLLCRYKQITFESYIYVKNRKILPFFKPVVFGPLRIDVNDKHVKKAEFYVNGKLKDTVSEPPFVWTWDEPAFMKHTFETKVYDTKGKSSSSGEISFFMFNSPRLFR
jgi:nitrous oxidase accessory protein